MKSSAYAHMQAMYEHIYLFEAKRATYKYCQALLQEVSGRNASALRMIGNHWHDPKSPESQAIR